MENKLKNALVGGLPPAISETKLSPLHEANTTLQREITTIQDVVDSLFAAFSFVLKPEEAEDGVAMADPGRPLQSEHVAFLADQTDRLVGIRYRLLYLKNRSEV